MLTAAHAELEERVTTMSDASVLKVELVALPMRASFKLADVKARLPDVSESTITKVLGALRK